MNSGYYLKKNYSTEEIELISKEHRQMCLELLTPTFVSNFLFPLLMFLQFYEVIPNNIILSWLGGHVLLNLSRIYMAYIWYPHSKSHNKETIFDVLFLTSSFLSALLWIMLMPFVNVQETPFETLFFYVMIYGLVSGAMGLGSYWPLYYIITVLTFLSGYFIQISLVYDKPLYFLGIAILFYAVFLIHIALSFNKKSASLIVLKKKNEKLAHKYESQQKETQKIADSRKSLLAATSHDLRQPLQAMHLLLAALPREEHDSKLIDQLESSAEGMTELLDRMLDLSKLESDTLEVHKQSFNLNQILTKLLNLYEIQAQEKNLTLTIEPCTTHIYTDDMLLERILSNIVSNAIKYTHEGGITVHTRSDVDQHIAICITDTGIGLSEQELSVVFQEFTQLHNPERDRKKGLGLGLSIVKRLSSILNLSIELNSKKGQGSEFVINVPLATPDTSNPVTDISQTDPIDVSKKVIAIIDDDEDILNALASLLSSWGAKVIAAESATECLNQLRQHNQHPDLIISDYRLRHKQTGVEAINTLKSNWPKLEIPAFLLSGDTAPEHLVFVKEQGLELLHKPIRPAQLRALLQRAIRL